MSINKLRITHFRNISSAEIEFSSAMNVIYGENGSGKTSLLEAIYCLCLNRSFRSHLNQRIIQHGKESFELFAQCGHSAIGIQRSLNRKTKIRLDGVDISNIMPIVKLLPIQLVDFQSFELINGPREIRRQFLDWGVFHVEHQFAPLWGRYKQIIKQRNAALKKRLSVQEVTSWDVELASLAEKINQQRRTYIESYLPILRQRLADLLPVYDFIIEFNPGWDESIELQQILREQLPADYQLGYTRLGAHRADITLFIGQIPLKDILSRGQQKLTSALMLLIQGELLETTTGKRAMFLIDDLPAELDIERRRRFIAEFERNQFQTFITATDPQLLPFQHTLPMKMFHVEHGMIR